MKFLLLFRSKYSFNCCCKRLNWFLISSIWIDCNSMVDLRLLFSLISNAFSYFRFVFSNFKFLLSNLRLFSSDLSFSGFAVWLNCAGTGDGCCCWDSAFFDWGKNEVFSMLNLASRSIVDLKLLSFESDVWKISFISFTL